MYIYMVAANQKQNSMGFFNSDMHPDQQTAIPIHTTHNKIKDRGEHATKGDV